MDIASNATSVSRYFPNSRGRQNKGRRKELTKNKGMRQEIHHHTEIMPLTVIHLELKPFFLHKGMICFRNRRIFTQPFFYLNICASHNGPTYLTLLFFNFSCHYSAAD
jgi:hypothetical protein